MIYMAKKRKKSRNKKRKSKNNFIITIFKYLFIGIYKLFKYIFVGIYNLFKYIFIGIYRFFKWVYTKFRSQPNKDKTVFFRNKYFSASKAKVSKIKVLETIKGDYKVFLNNLMKSDSLIGIVIGARGSGKTATTLKIAEDLKTSKKKVFAMGFSNLPNWIKIVEEIDDIKNDSLVVIDEGGILFSSRKSMSNSNKLLSDLLLIARHKNLTILFISQNSSNLDINTLRQADFLILKRSSLLQKSFERKIIAKTYEDYSDKFKAYKDNKGASLIYSDEFIGFIENGLPSFWSSSVSKGFR